jgi:trimethylamine--corrinoid protein Co-methyltransferase
MPDPLTLEINTAFAALAGTTKHVMVSAADARSVDAIADLCAIVAGSEAAFRERPFLSLNVNHVAQPLRFAPEACETLLAAARRGVPAQVNTFGQLGASSPVTIAGCVAQTVAETLAGMVVAWLADPGIRAVFGPRPMVTDLRTGAMAGGGGEQALLTALSVQMAQFYGLPNSTIAGATDSKIPDAQSGHEKCLSITLAAQAGCNLITQAAGMQAGLMGCSFDAYVIDNDMLGAILRSLAPVEIGADALDAGAIGEVARGEGHFLGRPETLARMERDFVYPRIGDRRSPEDWAAGGAPDIREAAAARARAILAAGGPRPLDPETETALRARFDIRLPSGRTKRP